MLDRIADGRTDLVFDLVSAGHPADSTDSNGVSLLSWCAYYGDVSAIKFLLANGETLARLGDDLGLINASFHDHWRLCQFLIDRGAEVNYSLPHTGETSLHAALSKPNMPVFELVVEILLAHGADPNSATRESAATDGFMRDCRTRAETPIHRAAAFGSERTIQLLLDKSATIDAKGMNGDSPLTWASWHHRPAHVPAKLCYGNYRIHPLAVRTSAEARAAGWRGMEKSLADKPHL